MKHKVYITGTGRCGTTFLIILLSYLGLDTGYTRDNFNQHIFKNCNSGLDRQRNDEYYILKSPAFMTQFDRILSKFIVDYVIIPVRSFEESAKSRSFHNQNPGGLWNAKNYQEQLEFFQKVFDNYKKLERTHNIQTIYLNFNDMISSPEYLYNNLNPILKNIDLDHLKEAFEFASNHQKKEKMYKAYYVPQFPVNKITDYGMDLWVNIPNHPRHQYGFLDAILEHIDNTNHIDPVRITFYSDKQIVAGPAGVARLYALMHKRGYTHIPSIVSTQKYFDWFGENVVEIKDKEQIRSYLYLDPVDCGFDNEGRVHWHNQNPNEKQVKETFKVSPETLERFLKCI